MKFKNKFNQENDIKTEIANKRMKIKFDIKIK